MLGIKPMPFEARPIEKIVQADRDGLPFNGSDEFGRQAHHDRHQLLGMIERAGLLPPRRTP
jgi:hypothetical protein